MKRIKTSLLFLSVVCLTVLQAGAQKTTGKLSLEKSQKLQLENILKTVTSMEMMGQSMEMTADVNMLHDIEVKGKNDTSFFVNSTLTKMKSNASVMGQTMSFDSEKKEDLESESGKAMKGLLNVTQEMELDKNAKVLNIKKDTATQAAAGGMMDMMKNMLGGMSDMGNGASDAFQVLPAGKKAGDTWSDSLINDGIKIYRNFTLMEINGNDATVSFSGNQLTNKKVEQQGMEVNVSMDAKLSGESVVDISTGIVKQKTLNMDGTGTAEMMGQNIPMTTKVTSTTTVKSK